MSNILGGMTLMRWHGFVQCWRSYAVTSLEQKCREMVGKEVGEGEVRSGINRHQVQRWSECMMGMPS